MLPSVLKVGRKSAPARLTAPVDTGDGELTPRADAALRGAVRRVSARAAADTRRIKFDFDRNLVHQIGRPLPPAELRTPPRSKPKGGVLKRVSSLPQPREGVRTPSLFGRKPAKASLAPPASVRLAAAGKPAWAP